MLENTLDFKIDGINGNLKLVYGPFSQKLYQNNQEIKRKNKGLYIVFPVQNEEGVLEDLKLSKGWNFTYKAEFRGEKIQIENKPSTLQYILGLIPLVLILGGVIGVIIGLIGSTIIFNYIRQESALFKQIALALLVYILCAIVYLLVGSVFISLMYGIL